MHTLGLVLGLIGMNTAWIPGWGWGGVGLCFVGSLFGLRSVTDRHSRLGATGLGISAIVFAGTGLVYGLGMQIKIAGDELARLVLPLSWERCLALAGGAALALAAALVLARLKAHKPGLAVAFVALVGLHLTAASGLVQLDQERARAAPAASAGAPPSQNPSPR